jgi:hypothetical protein
VSLSRVREILASVMAAHTDAGSFPGTLCTTCQHALAVTGVGIALMNNQGPAGLVAATDGAAATLEDLQFLLGEGPAVDASRLGRPVLQPDLTRTATTHWPGFGRAAIEAGIAAVFAFPLQVGRIRLGVLDLYRDVAGVLDPEQLGEALAFADAGTRILLHLQDQMPLDHALHPDLAGGSQSQAAVHQATGMVAAQAGVGLGDALLMLRANAYGNERALLGVANDVVARRLSFSHGVSHDGS